MKKIKLDRATFKQIRDLLLPLVGSESEQRAFVYAAFFDTPIPARVNFGDPADTFAVHLVRICRDYGMLDETEHALDALLDALYQRTGFDVQQTIVVIRERITLENQPQSQAEIDLPTIETTTLIQKYYDVMRLGKWRQVLNYIEELETRADLPSFVQLDKQAAIEKIEHAEFLATRDKAYEVLLVMSQHEPPERVWEALNEFWKTYPDYNPDESMQKTARIGFETLRERDYDNLRDLKDIIPPSDFLNAFENFATFYPDYDPDGLQAWSIEQIKLIKRNQAYVALKIQKTSDNYRDLQQAFSKFSAAYPDYDPDDLAKYISEQIFIDERQKKYNELKSFIERTESWNISDAEKNYQIFLDEYSDYDPDDLEKLIKELQMQELSTTERRNEAYNALKEMLDQEPIWVIADALVRFWDQYPRYDPETLVDNVMFNNHGYREALRRILLEKEPRTLDLQSLDLIVVPPALSQITSLKEINLANNRLSVVPESVLSLSNLRSINISNNRLTRVPESISRLTQLGYVDLSNNELENLPIELIGLPKIKMRIEALMTPFKSSLTLFIAQVAIKQVLKALPDNMYVGLNVVGNPLSELPSRVVEGGNKAILLWLLSQSKHIPE